MKNNSTFPLARAAALGALLSSLLPLSAAPAADSASWDARHPKQIFAHYMGCYPVGTTSLSPAFMRKTEAALRPNGGSYLEDIGGRWRDFPLTPADYKPTAEESADLEIRRALRMGLDGFCIDVLAGQQTALATIDALFKAAEDHHYPFQITFCLDNAKQNATAVKYLMDKHGNSPNLARRDGKPLFLAYRSCAMQDYLRPGLKDTDKTSPENIEVYNQEAAVLEKAAGRPLYLMFDLNGFIPGRSAHDLAISVDPAFWKSAATILSKRFGGLSAFFWGGKDYDLAAQAAHAAGLDWGEPMWYQYQNLYWGTLRLSDGSDLLRDRWARAIANKATLLQEATWNDYTETTNFSPSLETGYAITDLTSLFIMQWKTGKMPEAKHDRIYLFYPPYTPGSPVYPFHETSPNVTQHLEVTTFLTAPASIVLPGRESDTRPGHDMTWQAPAGLFVKKLAPTPGPVTAEIYRRGKKVLTFSGREPITDHPFRPDHTMVGACTEDETYWKEDFPNSGSFPPGYYGDIDHDGLPNWFEMYWFGHLGDFSTATSAQPGDPTPDGSTNLHKFLARENPVAPPKPPAAGTKWTLLDQPPGDSFNPETDTENQPAWRYFSGGAEGHWTAYEAERYSEHPGTITITHTHESMNSLNPPTPLDTTSIVYCWKKDAAAAGDWARRIVLGPLPGKPVKIEWTCPANGDYHVDLAVDITGHSKARLQLTSATATPVWSATLKTGHTSDTASIDLHLKKGEPVSLQADLLESHGDSLELTRLEITLATPR